MKDENNIIDKFNALKTVISEKEKQMQYVSYSDWITK